MTAWGVVAVCAIGGGVAGPFLERVARRVPKPVSSNGIERDPAAVADLADTPVVAVAAGSTAPAAPPAGTPAVGSAPAGSLAGPLPPAALGEVVAISVVTAGVCALGAVRIGAVPSLAAFCALFGGLVAVSVTDLRTGLVPRRLLYPTLGLVTLGLVAACADAGAWRPLLDAAVGGAVAFAVFYAIWWVYPKGLGFGDVRLAGLCGLALGFLGFRQLYLGFLASFVVGALGGLAMLARYGRRRFPFAPALAAGTAFGVLWGGWLGNLWLHPG